MAAPQFQNRNGNVGRGNGSGNRGPVGDDDSGSDAKWLLYGMLFFAIVCFIMLPVTAMVLIEAKKTNVTAQAALIEAKKIRAELKPKKEETDE